MAGAPGSSWSASGRLKAAHPAKARDPFPFKSTCRTRFDTEESLGLPFHQGPARLFSPGLDDRRSGAWAKKCTGDLLRQRGTRDSLYGGVRRRPGELGFSERSPALRSAISVDLREGKEPHLERQV